jgi:CrcB protein
LEESLVKTLLVQYLSVAGAGALGAAARLFIATVCGRFFGTAFPIGTFVINITGSLFLGWFLAAIGHRLIVTETVRLAIAVGFVGAYTTFSTFMYESSSLLEDGSGIKAMLNLMGSLLVGLLAVRFGIWLGSR